MVHGKGLLEHLVLLTQASWPLFHVIFFWWQATHVALWTGRDLLALPCSSESQLSAIMRILWHSHSPHSKSTAGVHKTSRYLQAHAWMLQSSEQQRHLTCPCSNALMDRYHPWRLLCGSRGWAVLSCAVLAWYYARTTCGWAGLQEGSLEGTLRQGSSDSDQHRPASECSVVRPQQHLSRAADPSIKATLMRDQGPAQAGHAMVHSQQNIQLMSPPPVALPRTAARGQASGGACGKITKPAGQRPLLLQPDCQPTPKNPESGADHLLAHVQLM